MNESVEARYEHYRFRHPDYKHVLVPVKMSWLLQGRHGIAARYFRSHSDWMPATNGGYTTCCLYMNQVFLAIGIAECSPKDNFCYKTGREIAYEKAMEKVNGNQFPGLKQAITTGYHDVSGKQCPPLNSKL